MVNQKRDDVTQSQFLYKSVTMCVMMKCRIQLCVLVMG